MASYRSVQPLTATEAAYIAGLVDGEGTITLTRYHRNENRRLVEALAAQEEEAAQVSTGVKFMLRTLEMSDGALPGTRRLHQT
jgi:hypothetical protein